MNERSASLNTGCTIPVALADVVDEAQGPSCPVLEVARRYARHGIPVFPCSQNKKPRVPGGFNAATADLTVIDRWGDQGLWANGMVGIPTGHVSGFLVIDQDVDPGTGECVGEANLIRAGLRPEGTIWSETPSGGMHAWLRMPAGIDLRNTQNKLAEHVDTRANGGYVIAPGSVNGVGEYTWFGPSILEQTPSEPSEALLTAYLAKPNRTAVGGSAEETPLNVSRFAHIKLAQEQGDQGFFKNVRTRALAELDKWAPALFGDAAHYQSGTGAYRVSSKDLGRPHLQEDLSIHGEGSWDFGEEVSLTPIDAVMKWGAASSPLEAASWLCLQLGVDPVELGANPENTIDQQQLRNGSAEHIIYPTPDRSVISARETVKAPPFNPEWLGSWADWMQLAATRCRGRLDYPFFSLLATISGIVGRALRFRVELGWDEIAAIWVILLGRPGTGKSPILKVFTKAMYLALQRVVAEWLEECERVDEYNANLAEGEKPKKKPRRPSLFATSFTTEAAVDDFVGNGQRSLFCAADEFAQILNDIVRHSGGDRASLLSGWSGGSIEVRRITREPLSVEEFYFAILSGMQPEPFAARVPFGTEDGFGERFWAIYPERVPPQQSVDTKPKPELDVEFLARALDPLLPPTLRLDGADRALVMTDEARVAFLTFKHGYDQKAFELEGSPEEAIWDKMPAHVIKLAGILELAEWIFAFGEGRTPRTPTVITKQMVERAHDIATGYLLPMMRRSLTGAEPKEVKEQRRLAEWLLQQNRYPLGEAISCRQISRHGPRDGSGNRKAADVRATAQGLQDAGWLIEAQDIRGNANCSRWIINPRIAELRRDK